MSAAAPNDPTAADAAREPDDQLRQFPGYETLGVLGMGGMGVVYRARQAALQRLVAIKTLRNFEDAAPKDLARFRFEAEIVAQLSHPHIVQLYHVGDVAGQPFLAFELVEGGNLAKKIAGEPQPPRAAAQLVQTLSLAVHAAHLRGIIHRDLTPSNILLTNEGTPKIADFGLARSPDRSGQSEVIAGTASYMAPEQAWGDGPAGTIGPATDVYGLGAILYEMLTGRPPFKGTTSQKTLLMVYHDPPVRPSAIVPTVPHDLETICLRCLEKDPARRFASADELSRDLRRYLQGEPIHSRAVGWTERAWLWSRRNPLVAGLAASLLVAVIGGLGGTIYKAIEASQAAYDFHEESKTSKRLASESEARRKAAVAAQTETERASRALRNQVYEFLILAAERDQSASDKSPEIPEFYPAVAASLQQCPAELRNFEWHWLRRRNAGTEITRRIATGRQSILAVGHDGTWLATGGSNGTTESQPTRVWNTKTWQIEAEFKQHAFALAASTVDPYLAILTDNSVVIWDRSQKKEIGVLQAKTGVIAWSHDGKRIAMVGGGPGLTLDENGKFTSKSRPFTIDVYDVSKFPIDVSAKPIVSLGGFQALPQRIAFAPDQKHLAAVCSDRVTPLVSQLSQQPSQLIIWNLETKETVATVESKFDHWSRLAISHDSKWCAVSDGYGVQVYSFDGERQGEELQTSGEIYALAFAPQSDHLLATGWLGVVQVLEIGKEKPIYRLRGHTGPIRDIGWLPDGKAVTLADDGCVKIWDWQQPTQCVAVAPLAVSPNGSRVAAQEATGGSIGIWNTTSRRQEFVLPAIPSPPANQPPLAVAGMTFAKTGDELAVIYADRVLRRWDLEKRQVSGTQTLDTLPIKPSISGGLRSDERVTARFSPDGKTLLLATQWLENVSIAGRTQNTGVERVCVELWDIANSRRVDHWEWRGTDDFSLGSTDPATITSKLILRASIQLSFDPQGRQAHCTVARILHANRIGWDIASSKRLAESTEPISIDKTILSPDGSRRVTSATTATRILDARSGHQLAVLGDYALQDLTFSADGRILVGTRSTDKTQLEIFDARPLESFGTPPSDAAPIVK